MRPCARDPLDLSPRLFEFGRRIDADNATRPLLTGEAGDHPGMRGARHTADDDRVEEDAELGLLLGDLVGPASEPEPTELVVRCTGWDRVRSSTRAPDIVERCLPAVLEPDPESGLDEVDLSAHDSRQQDVAHPVVDRVRPVHPTFLDEAA